MSKNFIALALAAGLIFGGTGWTLADNYSNPTSNSSSNPAQTKVITGSVTNIDSTNNTIQVKDNTGAIQTVVVDQNVKVTKDGQQASLNDLKIGDVVSVNTYNKPTQS